MMLRRAQVVLQSGVSSKDAIYVHYAPPFVTSITVSPGGCGIFVLG
jgi:hypothetical protein